MPDQRERRGRVYPAPKRAPNAEPVFLPEKPKRLEFGKHIPCSWCKSKGKKGGNICGVCGGIGVIDEGPRGDDHP